MDALQDGVLDTPGTDHKDPRLLLVSRIASDPLFSRSVKLRELMQYAVEQTLAQRGDRLSEQEIGVVVFKRRPDYNPNEDNIVRSYARLLRTRLEQYFLTTGSHEPVILTMPKGGYSIVFQSRALDHSNPPEREDDGSSTKRKYYGLVLLFVVALLGGFALGVRFERATVDGPLHQTVARFWSKLLQGRETTLIAGDTGLSVVLGLTQEDISPQSYMDGTYLRSLRERFPDLLRWDRPLAHQYSAFADIIEITRLLQVESIRRLNPDIRYSRFVRPNELARGNIFLFGGSNANPWVKLFDTKLNFTLEFLPGDRNFRILNANPVRGELNQYPYHAGDKSEYTYGLVAIEPWRTGSGLVILFEGTTDIGMRIAAEFFQQPDNCQRFLPKLIDGTGKVHGFEALLRSQLAREDVGAPDLVGYRFH